MLISNPILLPMTRDTDVSQRLSPFPIIQESPVPTAVETESEASSSRKRRSQSRATPEGPKKSCKLRASSLPYDPDADPGEDLDPTAVTMAALCDDNGWGRVSSKAAQIVDNHLAWKRSNREKRAQMRANMEAKKYGRNDDDTGQPSQNSSVPEQSTVTKESAASAEPGSAPTNEGERQGADEDPSGSGFDYSQDVATSRYNVQIRIGPNGETIIDEESLFVDRNTTDETADYTHVEESDVTKFVNSGTYGRRYRSSRWSAEETELFFDVSVGVQRG
jgi:transcription factor TFIIIB component B''